MLRPAHPSWICRDRVGIAGWDRDGRCAVPRTVAGDRCPVLARRSGLIVSAAAHSDELPIRTVLRIAIATPAHFGGPDDRGSAALAGLPVCLRPLSNFDRRSPVPNAEPSKRRRCPRTHASFFMTARDVGSFCGRSAAIAVFSAPTGRSLARQFRQMAKARVVNSCTERATRLLRSPRHSDEAVMVSDQGRPATTSRGPHRCASRDLRQYDRFRGFLLTQPISQSTLATR